MVAAVCHSERSEESLLSLSRGLSLGTPRTPHLPAGGGHTARNDNALSPTAALVAGPCCPGCDTPHPCRTGLDRTPPPARLGSCTMAGLTVNDSRQRQCAGHRVGVAEISTICAGRP